MDAPIVVLLSAENDALEIVDACEKTIQPPAPGQPRSGNFVVKGVKAGLSRLAVTFRQGGSELGVIGLAIEVVASGVKAASTQGSTTAAPADLADDDKLAVIIEQRVKNGEVFYRYLLHSEARPSPVGSHAARACGHRRGRILSRNTNCRGGD
jgi:hypothetical protein